MRMVRESKRSVDRKGEEGGYQCYMCPKTYEEESLGQKLKGRIYP